MTKTKRIIIGAGDIGGCKEVEPAVRILIEKGIEIEWRVDPSTNARAGTNVLVKRGIAYSTAFPQASDSTDLVLVGTSATAMDMQIALSRFAREKEIPCIHVEDFPGTAHYPKVRVAPPTTLCVVDEVAAEIARHARPEIPDIRTVGKPSYAEEVGPFLDSKDNVWEEVRKLLGLERTDFVIAYSSGGTAETVMPHILVLADLGDVAGRRTVLLDRLHPKLPDGAKVEARKILADGKTRVVDSSAEKSLERVALAADIVVCTWGSTVQFAAALAGVPPVLTLFPDDQKAREEIGYVDGVPPLIRSEAGFGASSALELKELLFQIASQPKYRLQVRQNGRKFDSWVKPGAAERIAAVVMEKLGV